MDNTLILAAAVVVAILIALALWLRLRPLILECKDPLFSPEYRAFLGQLDIAVRSHLTIFPMLPINDVLTAQGAGRSLLNKYRHQRFDFVVCHRREMEVLCVIQLERPGTGQPDSTKLRELCDGAGLTLLEYDVKPYRDVPTLRHEVFSACGIDEFELPLSSFEEEEDEEKPPTCPKCQAEMKRHTINKGKHAGSQCWVCVQYPDCKGARLDHS